MHKIVVRGREHNPPHVHVELSGGRHFRVEISDENLKLLDEVEDIAKSDLKTILDEIANQRLTLIEKWYSRNPELRRR